MKLQSLLNLCTDSNFRKEFARVLSEEVHGKFNINPQKTGATEHGFLPSCSIDGNLHPASQDDRNQRDQQRKSDSRLQKKVTPTPYNDGHQWRKYGEKKISGSAFPRSYYRCTYREDKGCQATKQVQQQGYGDPPLFLVTYKGKHTCNTVSTTNHHIMPCYQQKRESQQKNCNIPPPFSLVSNERENACNVTFDTVVESPAVQPFLLHFDSSACEIEQPKRFNRGSRSLQNKECTLSGEPALCPTVDPTLMDFSNFNEEFLDETLPPSSLELDISDMMMDSSGFDFDDMELFQIIS